MNKKEFIKIIHASILGDGYFYKVDQGNIKQNTHYAFKQQERHKDYVEYLADIVENLTKVHVYYKEPYTDKRGYNIKGQYEIKTMRHPTYKKMYNRLYRHVGNTHIKNLDPHYMKLIDWHTLGIMYMDDGWIDITENKTKENYVRVSLATHCFTYYENIVLTSMLWEKFGVRFNVKRHKQKSGEYKYYLDSSKDHAKKFIDGVTPFILPSFNYKLEY